MSLISRLIQDCFTGAFGTNFYVSGLALRWALNAFLQFEDFLLAPPAHPQAPNSIVLADACGAQLDA